LKKKPEREFAEAVTFYDEREPGVGQRFAQELRAFFKTVCDDPERFRFASRFDPQSQTSEAVAVFRLFRHQTGNF